MNTVITLKLSRSLDTFPGRSELDEDALLLDANGLIKSNKLLGLQIALLSKLAVAQDN